MAVPPGDTDAVRRTTLDRAATLAARAGLAGLQGTGKPANGALDAGTGTGMPSSGGGKVLAQANGGGAGSIPAPVADYRHFKFVESICPVCRDFIQAEVLVGFPLELGDVIMRKTCASHGDFEVMVYSSADVFVRAHRFNRPGDQPAQYLEPREDGLPTFGLWDHEEQLQHTCVGIIELTDLCNLDCPVCFADVTPTFMLPKAHVKGMIDAYVRMEGEPEVLQFSGGEPTLHPDLPELVRYALDQGVQYVTINTNGIRLAREPEFAAQFVGLERRLFVYLQYDGDDDGVTHTLRHAKLADVKQQAIDRCEELGINIVLVGTMVKGVNDDQVGDIFRLALSRTHIRAVSYQPATYVGRFDVAPDPRDRLTLSDIQQLLADQVPEIFEPRHFYPVPCPHPLCSSSTYVLEFPDAPGEYHVVSDLIDLEDYLDYSRNRTVVADGAIDEVMGAVTDLFRMQSVPGMDAVDEAIETALQSPEAEVDLQAICLACGIALPSRDELFDSVTLVHIHGFMDEYTWDLDRHKKCCVHEILPDGRVIPFCMYNSMFRHELQPTWKRFDDGETQPDAAYRGQKQA